MVFGTRVFLLGLSASVAILSGCVASMPPKAAPVDASASVRSLKLHVRSIANPMQFIGSVADPFRPALEAALVEAGLQPVNEQASADAMLDMTLGSKDGGSFYTTLRLSVEGRKIESVDLQGGAIGNRLNTNGGVAEAITANLVAQLAASSKVEAFSLEPRKSRAVAAGPAGGIDKEEMRRLMLDTLREASETKKPAGPAAPAAPALLSPSFRAAERPDDLAVIVGIETYSDIASKATYAERDADAFKAYVRALGVPERNIILLKGSKAGRAALTKNLESWLPRMAKPEGRVYFYFSGHGAPDVKTGQAYLVPWDGDPNFLEDTAYPIVKLYKTLGALPAKQVLVAMDSCFSGAGGRSVLASGARPLVGKIETGTVPAKVTVLAASAANEISGSLDDKGHGAFTYFLLEGLNAGKTTPKALSDYLTPRVQDEAKRLNRDQTPQLQGAGDWSLR